MTPSSISFKLRDGVKIAGLRFGNTASKQKAICLHGWLDNASSFDLLAPHIASELDYDVVAIDHVGHGHSSHKSYAPFHDYVFHAREIISQLGFDETGTHIIGHSMGTGIAILLAGAYPELAKSVVCLDGFGPVVKDEKDAATILRKSLDARLNPNPRGIKPKEYKSIEAAMEARLRAVKSFPGNQTLSEYAAKTIITRATEPFHPPSISSTSVKFRHDPSLFLPSPMYATKEMTEAFIDAIRCPTLLLRASSGWPPSNPTAFGERMKIMQEKNLLEQDELQASHHLHLDPESSGEVNKKIEKFLGKINPLGRDLYPDDIL